MASRPSTSDEAQILLVEDNLGDVRLIKEAFQNSQITNRLHTVTDGQEALDFIHRQDDHEDAPRPDIILLDLNLPRVDGEDVLHEIKHHPELKRVPVIVLSGIDKELVESRDLDHDVDEDAVIEKPVDPGEFVDVIRKFDGFRLSIIQTSDERVSDDQAEI